MPAAFTFYTTRWCGYCHRLKRQLHREGMTFDEVDIDADPEAAAIVAGVNGGDRTVPTLLFEDGSALTNPSVADVKSQLAS